MRKFTGKQYLCIAIANAYGMDKQSWGNRINWVRDNLESLEDRTDDASEPYLYMKAVKALRSTQRGEETGYIMSLDATASGPQLMACLTACEHTASITNLIDTGNREDLYITATKYMQDAGITTTREEMKPVVMTVLYGSRRQPKMLFGEDTPELAMFYEMLHKEVPGCMEFMHIAQSCWDPNGLEHQWTLPDGHVAKVKVMGHADKKVEIAEANGATFTHRITVNTPDPDGLGLPANIIQSIDGYVVREVLRRCKKRKVQVATIHDSFWAHPNDMDTVRESYNSTLADILEMSLLQDILQEITGSPSLIYNKFGNLTGDDIRQANYALS